MKKIILACGAAAVAFSLSACATVTRGSHEKFTIQSSPSEADVRLSTGQTCVTPCTLSLKRKSKFVVKVSKEGYVPQEAEVHGKVKGGGVAGGAGNAILGGGIGLGVDAITGAMLSLSPNPVTVTLVPVAGEVTAAAAPAAEPVPAVETTPLPDAAPAADAAPAVEAAPPADAAAPAADAATPAPSVEAAPAAEAAPAPGE